MRILALILILFLCELTPAQQAIDARSVSMGFSNSADTRGLAQVGLNPATLALPYRFSFEMNLFSIQVSATNNGLSKNIYDQYFTTGKRLTRADKDAILNRIPAGGLDGNLSAQMNTFALYIPNFSLSLSGAGSGNLTLPRQIWELGLDGNKDLDREYQFNNLDGKGWGGLSAALSLAMPFHFKNDNFFQFGALGFTAKYFVGLGYGEILESNGWLQNAGFEHNFIRVNSEISMRTSRGGSGIGLDFGALIRTQNEITVGISLLNALGNIKWIEHNELRIFSVQSDSLSVTFNGLDEDVIVDRDTTLTIGSFTTRLPIVLDIGAAFPVYHKLLLSAELEKGLNDGLGGSRKLRTAFGIEFTGIPLIPLRSGISLGGNNGFSFAFGTGLDLRYWHIDVGVINHGGFSQGKSRGLTLAATSRIRF